MKVSDVRLVCAAVLGIMTMLVCTSCVSTGPTVEERKARVPEFRFAPTSIAPDAYHTPDAKWMSSIQMGSWDDN